MARSRNRPVLPVEIENHLDDIEEKVDARHEENEKRFDRVENKIIELTTQVKIIIALLVANGAINIAHFFG